MKSITTTFNQVCEGLLMPSESEYPFTAFVWQEVSLPELDSKLMEKLDLPAYTPIEKVELDYFFRNVAQEKEWHDDSQRAAVLRFSLLIQTLHQYLKDLRVYRVGKIEIDVYIVGQTAAGLVAGLQTKLIET